jgi:hypothetical protein
MTKPIKEIPVEDLLIRIYQDDDPRSPDDDDNEDAFIVYEHRNFAVSRNGFDPSKIHEALQEAEDPKEFNKYHIWVVNAYIHSGVSLSLSRAQYPFNDRWDVSTTGYCLISRKEWPDEAKAKEVAESVIKEWNQYLLGDVYYYEILKPYKTYTITEKQASDATFVTKTEQRVVLWKDEVVNEANMKIEYEQLNSCSNFYGIKDVEEEAVAAAKNYIENTKQ